MVPFSKSLEVHIPLLGVGNIREIDAQPAMSNNSAEVVNLSAPQAVAYDSESNRPGPVTSRNGGSPNVGNNHGSGKTAGGRGTSLREACSAFFGDGGPPVGNSKNKHFTEGDQRLYSTGVSAARRGRRGIPAETQGSRRIDLRWKCEYYSLFDPKIYETAYHNKIKSESGNMTPGVDDSTLDGFSKGVTRLIIDQMKDRSLQFQPTRREFIPKAGGKIRPLGIPSLMDEVVREAIKKLLEPVFEPKMADESYGFKPGLEDPHIRY